MNDFKKSKKELIAELVELRKRVAGVNVSGPGIKKNGEDEKFHVLFETAQDAIFIMEDGLYVDCNQKALEIFKCTKEQIIASSPEKFSPAIQPDGRESRTSIKKIIKAALSGEPQFFKWQHKKFDQTLFSAEVSIKQFEFSNEIYILAIVRDITEIKKTQDALIESQQRYELATTAAKIGVWDFNPETRNLYIDTHMKHMLGYDDQEISEHMDGWFNLVHPDDKEMVYKAVGAHLNGETDAVEITHRMMHKDGSIRWLLVRGSLVHNLNGDITRMVGTSTDITDNKLAEKIFQEREQLFHSLMETMLDAAIILDWNGIILFANNSAAELIGVKSPEIAYGKNALEFVFEEYHEDLKNHLMMVMNNDGGFLAEYMIRAVDGSTKWVEGLGTKVQFEGMEADFVTIRDITDRRSAEEKLRKSEERYRALFELSPSGIMLEDSKGIIIDVNPAVCKSFGSSRKELIGLNVRDIASEGRDIVGSNIKNILAGQYLTHEVKNDLKDGTRCILELKEIKIQLPEGKDGILVISDDITERKRVVDDLQESEEKYRILVEQANDGIAIIQNTIAVYVNPMLAVMRGCRVEDLVGTSFKNYVHPDELPKIMERYQQRRNGKNVPAIYETILQNANGDNILVEINVGLMTYQRKPAELVIVRDISQRKAVENALRDSEEKIRAMFNSVADAIVVTDFDGKILQLNDTTLKIYGGNSRDAVIGNNLLDYVIDTEREDALKNMQMIRHSGVRKAIQHHSIKNNGEIFPVELSAAVLRDSSGEPTGFIASIKDISERKQLEEQLFQALKMEAVGRLAGGVAHDFNNLLTIIQGYVDLGFSKITEAEPLFKYLVQIRNATERAESLTRQLLAFGRKQVLQLRVINLNSLIAEMEKMLRRVIPENIELKTKLDGNSGNIKADPAQIERVIINLAVNARDAMLNGGRLVIETRQVEIKHSEEEGLWDIPGGTYILLSVSDNGIGMSKTEIDHVFEPFYTTKDSGQGTGLGLSTVHGIVTQSGGYVKVDSRPNVGSTFNVYLPWIGESAEAIKKKSVIDQGKRGDETIMVVEDEDEVRNLVCETLSLHGYKILEASNGGLALLICEKYKDPIDLILTDVVMPKMNGYELLDRLLPIHPEMKSIFMSGYTENEHVQKRKKGSGFIQKPFTPKQLLQIIREALD